MQGEELLGNLRLKYSKVLEGLTLEDSQCMLLEYTERVPRTLICLDTGLGKTLVSLAKITLSKTIKGEKNWIVVGENNTLQQWEKAIKKSTRFKSFTVTGEQASVDNLYDRWVEDYEILLITYEALLDDSFINWTITHGGSFTGLIIDEGKNIAGFNSIRHKCCRELAKYYSQLMILNATPAVVSPSEILAQMAVITGRDDYERLVSRYIDPKGGFRNLEELAEFCSPYVIGYSRRQLGVQSDIHPIRVDVENSEEKIQVIEKMLLDYGDKKMLIYADKDINKDLLKSRLGIPVMDGRNKKERPELQKWFNDNSGTVMCTNVTTGLNLEADISIFFEITAEWRQFIGRGERGYEKGRKKIVVWLIDDDEAFQTIVQNRGELHNIFTKADLKIIRV